MMSRRGSAAGWIAGVIVIAIVVAIAGWIYLTRNTRDNRPFAQAPAPAASAPPAIRYPIGHAAGGPATASSAALPLLGDSDSLVADALSALPGAGGLRDLLITRAIVPHIVATVDALPRHTIDASILPLRTPPGSFMVAEANGQRSIDPKDYDRYAAYMQLVETVDTKALVAWYVRYYPLLQQAYRELGYPKGYFNDRLIEAIDDMLAAPNAQPPVMLLPSSNGHYVYADLTWESLSVGQKLMIRIGPDNEARLKAKLRAIRSALIGNTPRD